MCWHVEASYGRTSTSFSPFFLVLFFHFLPLFEFSVRSVVSLWICIAAVVRIMFRIRSREQLLPPQAQSLLAREWFLSAVQWWRSRTAMLWSGGNFSLFCQANTLISLQHYESPVPYIKSWKPRSDFGSAAWARFFAWLAAQVVELQGKPQRHIGFCLVKHFR